MFVESVGQLCPNQSLKHPPEPDNIYVPGITLQLYEHTAPPEKPVWIQEFLLDEGDLILERSNNGRLINCGRHTMRPSYDAFSLDIQLVRPLSTGLRCFRFAQVWQVTCGSETCIARIYDPLYVEDGDGTADIFRHIDQVVSVEARVYDELRELQGNLIPKFMGCFLTLVKTTKDDVHVGWESPNWYNPHLLFDIPRERSVYVILLKFIPGRSLLELRPGLDNPVCALHRNAVLRAVYSAHHEMAIRGIWPNDFSEGNLILKDNALLNTTLIFCSEPSCVMRGLDIHSRGMLSPVSVIDLEDVKFIDGSKYWRLVAAGFKQCERFPDLALTCVPSLLLSSPHFGNVLAAKWNLMSWSLYAADCQSNETVKLNILGNLDQVWVPYEHSQSKSLVYCQHFAVTKWEVE
ncbi:hypothetical protein C8R43DRAFT_1113604 [Mycena crocata]|nr:hypothetical protein C8R43DRAFT_1113604 [Mycena crocata]